MMYLPALPIPETDHQTRSGVYRVVLFCGDGCMHTLARRDNFYAADQRMWEYIRREILNDWQIAQHDPSDAFGAYQLTYDHPTKGTLMLMIGVMGGMDQ